MSYDLAFWSQEGPLDEPPEAVYRALLDGRPVAGLQDLDIDGFLTAILDSFPGAIREPNGPSEWIVWDVSDGEAVFEVEWSRQHVLVICRGTGNEDMNRLVDIAVAHDCRLYDPQANERFDSE